MSIREHLRDNFSSLEKSCNRGIDAIEGRLKEISGRLDTLKQRLAGSASGKETETCFRLFEVLENDIYRYRMESNRRIDALRESLKELEEEYCLLERKANTFTTVHQIATLLHGQLDPDRLLQLAMDKIIEITGSDRGYLIILDETGKIHFRVGRELDHTKLDSPGHHVSRSVINHVCETGEAVLLNDTSSDDRFCPSKSIVQYGIQSILCVPLRIKRRLVGSIYVDSSSARNIFLDTDLEMLSVIADQICLGLGNALFVRELQESKARLESMIRSQYRFESFSGRSPTILKVLDMAGRVARSRASILIEGESGTGKDILAKAVHHNSPRVGKPYVHVTCSAMTESIVESELFGHERGAFTDAKTRHQGRFETAHQGTVFLNEIGDMPLQTQAKLLRFIQDGEFERVGGTETLKVDVRIIAATNKNLREEMARGNFREDLFHRISAISIKIPPLRERRDDIPLLVEHFVRSLCEEEKMSIKKYGMDLLDFMDSYDFPGNVRELRNLVHRLIILSRDDRLHVPDLPPELLGGVKTPGDIPGTYAEFKVFLKDVPKIQKADYIRLFLKRGREKYGTNLSKLARGLEIPRKQIYRWAESYQIDFLADRISGE